MRCMSVHGEHVDSISIEGPHHTMRLHELPNSLTKLSSLSLSGVPLQLQPGNGWQGVLSPALHIEKLQLERC